jgi:hypothetical protein
MGDECSHSVSLPVHPGGIALPETWKAEALPDTFKAQLGLVTFPSVPAAIEMVYVALESYLRNPAGVHNFNNPDEFQESIRGLNVSKHPGRNGILNRAPKHFSLRVVFILVKIFNAILCTHNFPPVWKHA